MKLIGGLDQHGVSMREIDRENGYENTQTRTSFKKPKFSQRQFMIIASASQTFEGVVRKKNNGDIEYISGFITYSDGRIEQVL